MAEMKSKKRSTEKEQDEGEPSRKKQKTRGKSKSGKSRIRYLGQDESFYIEWPKHETWMVYIANFLTKPNADDLVEQLKGMEKQFRDEKSFYGNPPARQVLWLSNDWDYPYAGTNHPRQAVPKFMTDLARQVETKTQEVIKVQKRQNILFQSLDELPSRPLHILLGHGSLAIMGGKMQHTLVHGVPKVKETPQEVGVRFNCTFRQYAKDKISEGQDDKPSYTGVLVNRYKDGTKSVAMHSDKENNLAPGVPIASLSVGAVRDFVVKRATKK